MFDTTTGTQVEPERDLTYCLHRASYPILIYSTASSVDHHSTTAASTSRISSASSVLTPHAPFVPFALVVIGLDGWS